MSRTVLITRHPADCSELRELLAPHGNRLHPYPVLRLETLDPTRDLEAVCRTVGPGDPGWLLLASPRAARPFVGHLEGAGASHLARLPAAAVGRATADAGLEVGLRVEVVGPGTGLGLAEELAPRLPADTPLVFPCGRHRRSELPDALTAAGHRVFPVEVYAMLATPPRELPPLPPTLDAVVVTSPRAARLYLEGVGGQPLPCRHVALGPTTRDAAAALGIACTIPPEPQMSSLAEELCQELQE